MRTINLTVACELFSANTLPLRCFELITEAEIMQAIHRPLGAKSVDAVKRRVRAGMGRCQAGFCGPKVLEILSRELGVAPTEINKHNDGSYMVTGKTRE